MVRTVQHLDSPEERSDPVSTVGGSISSSSVGERKERILRQESGAIQIRGLGRIVGSDEGTNHHGVRRAGVLLLFARAMCDLCITRTYLERKAVI